MKKLLIIFFLFLTVTANIWGGLITTIAEQLSILMGLQLLQLMHKKI